MPAIRCGLDIAKRVFQVYGVDEREKAVIDKRLPRSRVREFFANLPPCLVGIEACGTAHYWARELGALGHEVRLMAPRFVNPYRKSGKNDRNDAIAICEAVSRPSMRFVPVKGIDQQAILTVHRARALLVHSRTALVNQIHGLMAEFGIVFPRGVQRLRQRLASILTDETDLPRIVAEVMGDLYVRLTQLDAQIRRYDRRISELSRESEPARRLMAIGGIGPLTATAMVAMLGNAREFRNGRELAAWLGLTPRQHSTGGRTVLGRITKEGDTYLRTLLIRGAHAVMRFSARRDDAICRWVQSLRARRGNNIAAVALAAKNARIAWALLNKGRSFDPNSDERLVYT